MTVLWLGRRDFSEFDLTLHDFNEFDLTLHDFDEFDLTLHDFNEFDITLHDFDGCGMQFHESDSFPLRLNAVMPHSHQIFPSIARDSVHLAFISLNYPNSSAQCVQL